jgi:hypothetical protein
MAGGIADFGGKANALDLPTMGRFTALAIDDDLRG